LQPKLPLWRRLPLQDDLLQLGLHLLVLNVTARASRRREFGLARRFGFPEPDVIESK
jgi:hypothetical protein